MTHIQPTPITARLLRRVATAASLGVATAALALPASPAHAVGAGTYVYAPNSFNDTMAIVDAGTGAVAATVPTGVTPMAAAISPNGERAYTADYGTDSVSVVDTAQEKVVDTIQLPFGASPWDLALSPDGGRLYVAEIQSDQLAVIDTSSDTIVDSVTVGDGPWAVAATASHVYVANDIDSTISVVDSATDQVAATIPAAQLGVTNPKHLALAPSSNLLYVAGEDDGVSVVDTSTNAVVRTRADISETQGVAVSPDGSKTYVVRSGSLEVLDSASSTTLASVDLGQLGLTGKFGEAVTVVPDGRIYVYADNATDGALVAVDPTTLGAVSTTPLPAGVVKLATGSIAPTPPPATKADVQARITGATSGRTNTRYTYTVTAKDAGPGTAARVGSSVLLPPGASLVSASGSYTRIGQLVVWNTTPNLAVNGSASYTVTVTFLSKGTKVLAAGAASLSTPDPRLYNNLSLISTRIQ